jgi:hypothetical protein
MTPEHHQVDHPAPSARDIRIFGVMWMAFFVVLAWMVYRGPGRLVWAAGFLGLCVLVSLTLNRALPLRRRIAGITIPLTLAVLGMGGRWLTLGGMAAAEATRLLAGIVVGAGLVGGVVSLARPGAGARMYRAWMAAAEPIGWTISHAILAGAFYLVLTPVGVAMRLVSGDPLRRAYDVEARTYWLPRRPVTDRRSYFRQF